MVVQLSSQTENRLRQLALESGRDIHSLAEEALTRYLDASTNENGSAAQESFDRDVIHGSEARGMTASAKRALHKKFDADENEP